VERDDDDDDGESKEENPDDRVQMKTRSKHVSTLDLNHAADKHPASFVSPSPQDASCIQHPL
jgi:hypothetical protein